MQSRNEIDQLMIASLCRVKGIKKAAKLRKEDRRPLLDKEQQAEARSLMGLGKVINTGMKEVLGRDLIYASLTSMDFDWGCQGTLVLKKGEDIVGEEVRDNAFLLKLSEDKSAWFLHKNFVVYKDRISFPHDIMKKICHFEIISLPAEFCVIEERQFQCRSIMYANPSILSDLYIKSHYFDMEDEKGLGTILVGVTI